MSEAVIKAIEEVEDECVVLNGLTKFGKLAGHQLELMKIVIDGDITLDKGTKFGIEERSTPVFVANELLLYPRPDDASHGWPILMVHHHLEKINGDHPIEPRESMHFKMMLLERSSLMRTWSASL